MSIRLLAFAGAVVLGATANAALVMDQLPRAAGDSNGAVFASQVFEPANAIFTVSTIDDFTVNASQLLVTNVTAYMGGWNGFADGHWSDPTRVRGFRVSIYSSIANAGDEIAVGSVDVAVGDATITAGFHPASFSRFVSLNVNLALPAAGTYWVGVQGLLDFGGGGGQIGVFQSQWAGNTPGGTNAWQANPGEGFGFGKTFPVDPAADAAYSVEAVPEPATMLALGGGLAALLARRRRKLA